MSIRGLGAVLIIAGCGGFGFAMAAGIRQQEKLLQQLIHILHILESELQYRLTSLPELCRLAGGECDGILRNVFRELTAELSRQDSVDAAACMEAVLNRTDTLPGRLRMHLQYLGKGLGRFDLTGQLQALQRVRGACEADLAVLGRNREQQLRSYQTLSLCAGTALVILFV